MKRKNTKLDAAVHPVPWPNQWEAPYPEDSICLSNTVKTQKVKTNDSSVKKMHEKASVNVGDRVRSTKNGRTAVIIESTLDKIVFKYDDDGSIESIGHKRWIKETPFLPVIIERK